MAEEAVRPFSCGAQYADWTSRNCLRCQKWDADNASREACELDYALGSALLGSGEVTIAIAERAGVLAHEGHYTWDCPERVLRAPVEGVPGLEGGEA